jgi:hypothetical protein
MRNLELEDYLLPSWCAFFNVFHLYDPLGYRMEPLFSPGYADLPPVPIQRPSSTRSTSEYLATFYSDLVKKYVSDFPVPSWPGFSSGNLRFLTARIPICTPIPNGQPEQSIREHRRQSWLLIDTRDSNRY